MEIMDVEELAQYLKMKPVTIYKNLRLGILPAFKVGGSWRFRKKAIDDWIVEQEKELKESISTSNSTSYKDTPPSEDSDRSRNERVGEAPSIPKITVEDAKRLETLFLERFESVVAETQYLTDEERGTRVTLKSILGKRFRHDEKSAFLRHPACRVSATELQRNYPLNRSVSYGLKRGIGKLIPEIKSAEFEGRNWVRLEKMADPGHDEEPITDQELMASIGAIVDRGKRDGIFRIVGWFSPTGWTREALQLVVGAGQENPLLSIQSPYGAFFLIGPEIHRLHFNSEDDRASVMRPLFGGELPKEKISRCAAQIRERIVGLRHMTVAEASEELGFPIAEVEEAMFSIAEEDEDWELKKVAKVGLTLTRR